MNKSQQRKVKRLAQNIFDQHPWVNSIDITSHAIFVNDVKIEERYFFRGGSFFLTSEQKSWLVEMDISNQEAKVLIANLKFYLILALQLNEDYAVKRLPPILKTF